MVQPDLIVRSPRRSLCLSISKDGKLIVHAPRRLSINEIFKYIEEKEKWIVSKQKEIQNKLSINKEVITYKEFLFLGNRYTVLRVNGLKKIELTGKPPVEITEADFFIINYHNFPTEIICNGKKIN